MSDASDLFVLPEVFKAAKKNLSRQTWDYLVGGGDSETTLLRNRHALDSLAFRPRVCRDVWEVDCTTEFLGQRQRIPVFPAPIGNLQDLHPEGKSAVARGAGDFGVMSMHSNVAEPSLEETAAAHDGPKMYQFYVRGGRDWLDEWISRAVAAGYVAVAITVDLDTYGRRERDMMKRYKTTSQQSGETHEHIARFNWEDVAYIKKNHDIPLIIKGVATAEDARICCDLGVDVVYVSNHGGRQLDHGCGAIEVLPEIVEAVASRAQIAVDGGFLRGTDVVKAMILGADAVGLGKLIGYAMGAGGSAGVQRTLEILEIEVRTCLALLGVNGFDELDASYLRACEPVNLPSLSSAYPLVDEGY